MKIRKSALIAALVAVHLTSANYSHAAGVLYGFDDNTDQLVTIDPTTGAATAIGAVGFSSVYGLAYNPNDNVLYGADRSTNRLIEINVDTGAGTIIANFSLSVSAVSLSYNPTADLIYVSNGSTLYSVNPDTAATIAVGGMGVSGIQGLAWDDSSSSLYGVAIIADQLYSINPTTATATSIGSLGYNAPVGLSYDSLEDTLYGIRGTNPSDLYSIDKATGAGSFIGATGFRVEAMTYAVPEPSCVLLVLASAASFIRRKR